MEKIDIEWCKQHGMSFVHVNVARDISYYLEKDGNVIFVYTQSTTGEQKLYVRNPYSRKECELTVSKINKETVDDFNKLCELVNLENPFN